jgi:hypothetical protein
MVLSLSLFLVRESRLFVSWSAGDRCCMTDNDEDHGRSRSPGVEDREWSGTGCVLSGRMIGRSDDVVCGLYHAREDDKCRFFG